MRTTYICEDGDAPYTVNLTPELSAGVREVLKGPYLFDLACDMGARPRLKGFHMYIGAVVLVLLADGKIGVRRLYERVGRLFNCSGETARRCMDYTKASFDYGLCAGCLFEPEDLSVKAFGYLSIMEFVALMAAKVVDEALARLKSDKQGERRGL